MQIQVRSEKETIEEVRAFHSQLRQLIAARIPICLDPRDRRSSAQSMETLEMRFELHLSNRGTIESYVSDPTLPVAYRVALDQWLHDSPTEALDRLAAGAEGQRFFKNAMGFVLLQALLILSCVFLGMVCICLWLLPKMEQIRADSFVEPGPGLRMLSMMRDTLPFWGLLIPGLAVIALLFRHSLSQRLMVRLSPMREDSHALSEFQGVFARPARFQWLVSLVVIACGGCVLLQAFSVLGVTIEILTQLVSPP